MQEERRICYVITRAEETLYLTHATSRMLFGRPQSNMASRFLREIPEDLLENESKRKSSSQSKGNSFQSATNNQLKDLIVKRLLVQENSINN